VRSDIVPGAIFPDYELPDHTETPRRLSELQGEDPMILTLAQYDGNLDSDAWRTGTPAARTCALLRIRLSLEGDDVDRISIISLISSGFKLVNQFGELAVRIKVSARTFGQAAPLLSCWHPSQRARRPRVRRGHRTQPPWPPDRRACCRCRPPARILRESVSDAGAALRVARDRRGTARLRPESSGSIGAVGGMSGSFRAPLVFSQARIVRARMGVSVPTRHGR